ncbi:hypothetical protein BGW42_002185 [Actinomortierella wolfii]|nr:hypothetical protein BGW42_002185 [Actinomortierella wolfii]
MDLTIDAGIMEYLQSKEETRYITEVKRLSGGSANFVWRATVSPSAPAHVFDGAKTVIVKHAEWFGANYKDFPLDTVRMLYEDRVLSIVTRAQDKIVSDKVRVPKVYFFDTTHWVIVQEDAGSALHLKDYISSLQQPPSKELCTAIGSSLGEFIARLHLYGIQHHAELDTPEQMHSEMALNLSRIILYDNAPKCLERCTDFVSDSDKAIVASAAAWGGHRLMTEPETLAHGDFWPGNILVKTSADNQQFEQAYVVDWEMARYAPAAMDLGQLVAESITLHKYRHPCEDIQTSLLETYCKLYSHKLTVLDLKTAAIHTGCHLLVWAPATGWFAPDDKEKVKEIVTLGIEYIRHGWSEDWDWFRHNSSYRVMVEALKL